MILTWLYTMSRTTKAKITTGAVLVSIWQVNAIRSPCCWYTVAAAVSVSVVASTLLSQFRCDRFTLWIPLCTAQCLTFAAHLFRTSFVSLRQMSNELCRNVLQWMPVIAGAFNGFDTNSPNVFSLGNFSLNGWIKWILMGEKASKTEIKKWWSKKFSTWKNEEKWK